MYKYIDSMASNQKDVVGGEWFYENIDIKKYFLNLGRKRFF